jgi:hypothetical protein
MSIHVNPISETKERWLEKNGELLIQPPNEIKSEKGGRVVLCLVDNFHFTALAVIYDDRELEEFTQSDDPRPKTWYSAFAEDFPENMREELSRYGY